MSGLGIVGKRRPDRAADARRAGYVDAGRARCAYGDAQFRESVAFKRADGQRAGDLPVAAGYRAATGNVHSSGKRTNAAEKSTICHRRFAKT